MNTLLHTGAEILRQLIIDLEMGTTPAVSPGQWPCYVDSEPDGKGVPDSVITVYNTQGGGGVRLAQTGEDTGHNAFQVRVRCGDYQTGFRKIDQLKTTLLEHETLIRTEGRGVTISGSSYGVFGVTLSGPILRLGQEPSGRRWLWTWNAQLIVEQLG